MRIFVSYTTRNNEITTSSLVNFSNKIGSFGNVFVDLLHNTSSDKQERVIQELERSDIVILVKSQSTFKSEWVKFEIESANKKSIPIIEFQASELDIITEEVIGNRIFL